MSLWAEVNSFGGDQSMDAAKWKLTVRRLGILTILGVPLDVALAEPPSTAPHLKMQLTPARVVDSGKMQGNASRPFPPPVAVIRPASGNSSRGTFILPAGGALVQPIELPPEPASEKSQSTMTLVPANPTSGIVINPTIPSQSQVKLRPATPAATMHAATVETSETNGGAGFEFSLSDDEAPAEATQQAETKPEVVAETEKLEGAWKLSDDSMPSIVRPKAKSHVVVAAGERSSIKLPENIIDAPEPESQMDIVIPPLDVATTEPSSSNPAEAAEVDPVPAEATSEIIESSTTLSVVRDPVETEAAEEKVTTLAKPKPKMLEAPVAESTVPKPAVMVPAKAKVADAKEVATRAFPALGDKLGDIQLQLNTPKSVAIANAIRVQVEKSELCDAVALQGNILFVPRQAGTCRLAVWCDERETTPRWIEITVQASSPEAPGNPVVDQLHSIIQQRYTGSQVKIVPGATGLSVTGTAMNEQHAREILQLVRNACLLPVQDKLQVRAR